MLQSRPYSLNPQVRFDLTALDRTSDKVVVARLKVVNPTGQAYSLSNRLQPYARDVQSRGSFDPNSIGGIGLVDGVNSRLYHPLVTPEGRCLCSRFAGLPPEVPAGGSLSLDLAFPAPPADVAKLGLHVPQTVPFSEVPVTSRPGQKIDVATDAKGLDPATAQAGPPRILSLTATTESTSAFEDDDGKDLNVRISTDVLFAVNKADLTPAAQATLRTVSDKINKSPGNTVKVEGHADSSGNDAINQPLSERRAQSVQEALKKLVTRPGVTYEPQGYGSTKPIAPNDTEAGKKRNRRVVITFARPRPTPVPAQSASGVKGKTIAATTGPKGATIRIDELQRDANGFVALSWTLRNGGSAPVRVNDVFKAPPEDGYFGSAPSGVSLRSGDQRFRVVRDSEGKALASDYTRTTPDVHTVEQGKELGMFTVFKVPAEAKVISIDVPGFAKVDNIALS